jgi:hypothetical protein
LLAPVAEIAQRDAALDPFSQGQHRRAVIPVAGGEHQIHHVSVHVRQHVQLKAKEPALAGLAKPGALLPQ